MIAKRPLRLVSLISLRTSKFSFFMKSFSKLSVDPEASAIIPLFSSQLQHDAFMSEEQNCMISAVFLQFKFQAATWSQRAVSSIFSV